MILNHFFSWKVSYQNTLRNFINKMSLPWCCFKNCFYGTGFHVKTKGVRELPSITLDSFHMGQDVVLLKDGLRICGSGGALCAAPLVQSKSYFEVKLQQSGLWGIGLATRKTDLNKAPGGSDTESWVLCSDGTIRHNGNTLHSDIPPLNDSDIIGIVFDHIELNFFINGKSLEKPVSGIKGQVFPVLFVDDGCILDLIVDNFHHNLPNGFERIMIEQSLL